MQHLHGTAGTHHGDLGRRPYVVDVAADVLRRHDDVSTAVSLAQRDGHLRHRSLAIGEEQLGAVRDDAAVLLSGARQEARHVHQRHDRNVERVAEADEAGGLAAGVDVQHAGHELGLVGDDADRLAVEAGEAGDDVLA